MNAIRALKTLAAIAICASLMAAHIGASYASDLVITLPSVVEARSGSFLLGEYASIDGEAALADAAAMAVLAPSGSCVTREAVIGALSSAVPGSSVSLRMPERVRVVPESRYAAELRAMTSWQWRIDAEGPEIDDTVGFSLPPRVSPGARVVTAKVETPSGMKASRQIKMKWYQPVVYCKRPLVRGDRIAAGDLAMRIEPVAMNSDLASDISSVAGSVLRQSVAAGRPISQGDIDRRNVIKNGSVITLVSRVNGLGVEVKGVAMQRGSIGDTIKVRNESSKKVLHGVVIEPGKVLLD